MVHTVPSLMKIHPGVLEISCLRGKNNIFSTSSLTFDLWRWADLAQNSISSSTPHGAPLCQVWWKSTQGFLRYRVYEVKIAYLDQVYWPLTLGGSRPKSNQFIYSSWCIPGPSMIKIHQGVLEILCLRDSRTDGRTTWKHNASRHPMGRRHNENIHFHKIKSNFVDLYITCSYSLCNWIGFKGKVQPIKKMCTFTAGLQTNRFSWMPDRAR